MSRLLHLQVEVEGPDLHSRVGAVGVQEVPVMSPNGVEVPRAGSHEGEELPVGDVHNLPPVAGYGVRHLGLNVTEKLRGALHDKGAVYRAVLADSSQDEVLIVQVD